MTSGPELTHFPIVYIIILNWNQLALTLDCLKSLSKVDYPVLETVLVDNGSTDGSVSVIRSEFPHLHIIENRENLGFSEANNQGMLYALEQKADYVLLLNNDTVVDPMFVREMIAVAEGDDSIGIVGPKMYYFDRPEIIWCAGNSIHWSDGGTDRLQAEEQDVPSRQETPKEVDFITACGMAVKRRVIDEIGLLDPRFFIYYDETDWCVRSANKGFKVVYVPASKIWHKVSVAMGPGSPATDYYMTRNAMLFLAKNSSGVRRWYYLGLTLGQNIRTILAYTLKQQKRHLRRNRNARLLALRDVLIHRWGKMGPDVAAVCYGKS